MTTTNQREREPVGTAKVRVGVMARILGITRQHLSNLARREQVPWETVDGRRVFDVDLILWIVPRIHLRLPLMRQKASPHEEVRWAVEALKRGPWNMPTAPGAGAWYWYAHAKRDIVLRRKLLRYALSLGAVRTAY